MRWKNQINLFVKKTDKNDLIKNEYKELKVKKLYLKTTAIFLKTRIYHSHYYME